jgi:hypothetical protein
MKRELKAGCREPLRREPNSGAKALQRCGNTRLQEFQFPSQVLPKFAAMGRDKREWPKMCPRPEDARHEVLQRQPIQVGQFLSLRCQLCQPFLRIAGIGPPVIGTTIAPKFRLDQESIDGRVVQAYFQGLRNLVSEIAVIPEMTPLEWGVVPEEKKSGRDFVPPVKLGEQAAAGNVAGVNVITIRHAHWYGIPDEGTAWIKAAATSAQKTQQGIRFSDKQPFLI